MSEIDERMDRVGSNAARTPRQWPADLPLTMADLVRTRAEQLREEAAAELEDARVRARAIVLHARDEADQIWLDAFRAAEAAVAELLEQARDDAEAIRQAAFAELASARTADDLDPVGDVLPFPTRAPLAGPAPDREDPVPDPPAGAVTDRELSPGQELAGALVRVIRPLGGGSWRRAVVAVGVAVAVVTSHQVGPSHPAVGAAIAAVLVTSLVHSPAVSARLAGSVALAQLVRSGAPDDLLPTAWRPSVLGGALLLAGLWAVRGAPLRPRRRDGLVVLAVPVAAAAIGIGHGDAAVLPGVGGSDRTALAALVLWGLAAELALRRPLAHRQRNPGSVDDGVSHHHGAGLVVASAVATPLFLGITHLALIAATAVLGLVTGRRVQDGGSLLVAGATTAVALVAIAVVGSAW